MKLKINEKVADTYSQVKFGLILCKSVNNKNKTFVLDQMFNGLCAKTKSEIKKSQLDSIPKITNWHNIYKDISAKTFQTNLEKLVRNVLNSREVPFDDNLARIRDYFMLKWQLPIITFALNDIYGDIELTFEGRDIVYKDQGSILTKKWNSEQFERGNVNRETDSCVFIVENLDAYSVEELAEMMNELALMVQKYCFGANIEIEMLEGNELDLGIEGLSEFEGAEPEPEPEPESEAKESLSAVVADVLRKDDAEPSSEQEPIPAEPEPEPTPESQPSKPKNLFNDKDSIKYKVQAMLQKAFAAAFPDLNEDLEVEYPRDASHGDYACSIAMKLAKTLGQNPLEIAKQIAEKIEPQEFIGNVQVLPPGFINIELSNDYLANLVEEIAQGKELLDEQVGEGKTMAIDYSSPNIAKPLGVHHLLSTIIGQSLYNIYKNLGFNCVGVNHLGDWGTQFGKLTYAFKTWGDKKAVEKNPIPELLKLYVKFHDEAEQNSELEDFGRLEFKKLEDGDKENKKLWEWFVKLSMADLKKTYKKLGVEFDEYLGESFYNDKMEEILDKGKASGVFKVGEGGAWLVEFDDENMAPLLVQKSDGATLYSTRDLATINYRLKAYEPELLVYVVDSAQSLYFRQLFETATRMGYTDAKFKHVSFGRMSLPDKSMSTRKGNVVLLEEVLKDGIEKASAIVEEKSKDLKPKEQAKVTEMIATGAIKYNILSQNRNTDMVFEWNKMLSIEGNSAPYLQYTYARAASILRKADKRIKKSKKSEPSENQTDLFQAIEKVVDPADNKHEKNVARLLSKFQEHLIIAAQEYKPNLFSNYLYELAQAFNGFYNSVPVLQTEDPNLKAARINLTKAASIAIKQGLNILGIDVPERM